MTQQKHTRHRPDRPQRRPGADEGGAYWMFGMHAVRAALLNPNRSKKRLIATLNAANALAEEIAAAGIEPDIADARRFVAPIDPASVHQGVAMLVDPLDWGDLSTMCAEGRDSERPPVVLLLDRVTDPHNVGAILRSAEVFGARAVIAPRHNSAPETGALAKAASGALERQPYMQIPNLARGMAALKQMGYGIVGLAGDAPETLEQAIAALPGPLAMVMGAEGPGMRRLTLDSCDRLARIPAATDFASLNVSNAAAVALYAALGRG